ncbi:MAG: hypothetical protein KAS13_09200 [Candidatus Omnitrophica bacterium]|nr:hypothetical protein [Candidatus Omnitrophota bacterium]
MEKLTIVWNDRIVEIFSLFWDSIVFWRSMSLFFIGGLILAFICKDSIKRALLKEDAYKHDKEIFRLFDLIMPENKLNDILGLLEKKYFYDEKSGDYIDKFRDSLKEESRQYVNAKIKKAAIALGGAIKLLGEFIDKNFVTFPDGYDGGTSPAGRYPNPEIDGGGNRQEKNENKFVDFEEELKILTGSARNKYQKYRSSIKQNLHL